MAAKPAAGEPDQRIDPLEHRLEQLQPEDEIGRDAARLQRVVHPVQLLVAAGQRAVPAGLRLRVRRRAQGGLHEARQLEKRGIQLALQRLQGQHVAGEPDGRGPLRHEQRGHPHRLRRRLEQWPPGLGQRGAEPGEPGGVALGEIEPPDQGVEILLGIEPGNHPVHEASGDLAGKRSA